KKTGRKLPFDAKEPVVFDKTKLSASIATIQDTFLKSANQKEIKKVEGEMQEILDTKQETMGGDMQNRMNIKLWSILMEKVLIGLNVAFVSSDSTNSTNEVSTAYGVSTSFGHNSQKEGSSSYTDDLIYSFFDNQSSGPQLDHEDLEQVDEFDLEEMDLKRRWP
nr:hypothetical protein [Tanacetum cinerariifolium]